MKRYFNVTYHHGGDVYCANIAHAENPDAVSKHYSARYDWVSVGKECSEWEIKDAIRRSKPIVEID